VNFSSKGFENMRVFALTLALATAGFLAACDDAPVCTQESATAKLTELSTAIQALGAADPEKMAALAPRMAEIQATMTAEGADMTAACAAIDAMVAEVAAAAAPAQ
jgi:hypothetical protein